METNRDYRALYESPSSDTNFVPLEPAEGQIVMPGADLSGFYDWLKVNLNDRLRRAHSRAARAEELINATAESLPGYVRNYLATVSNPVLSKQFVLDEAHPPMGYLFGNEFDSTGLTYDWAAEFGAGRRVCLFPLIEVGIRNLDDDVVAVAYRNGRPMDSAEYRVYRQIAGLTLFVPFDCLAVGDVLDVEVRRMWNPVRWSVADVPSGSSPGFQILVPVDDLGAFYCAGDYKVYERALDGSRPYFRLVPESALRYAVELTADGSHLKVTYLGEPGPGGSLLNSDRDYRLALVNDSAGWAARVRVPLDTYQRTLPLMAALSDGASPTRWVDVGSVDAYQDRMPLPAVSADELMVLVAEPGATPADNMGHFKLVPNVDFVLRQQREGDGGVDSSRVHFYGYSDSLKARAGAVWSWLTVNTGAQGSLAGTGSLPSSLHDFNELVVGAINSQNPDSPVAEFSVYDFECVANALDPSAHFSSDPGPTFITMEGLRRVAESPYGRNVEDLCLFLYKHWTDIAVSSSPQYAPYGWSPTYTWPQLSSSPVRRYGGVQVSGSLGIVWLSDWTEVERTGVSLSSGTVSLEQVNAVMGDPYRLIFSDHQELGDISKWAVNAPGDWSYVEDLGGTPCIDVTGESGDTAYGRPVTDAAYGLADFDLSFSLMLGSEGSAAVVILKGLDVSRAGEEITASRGARLVYDGESWTIIDLSCGARYYSDPIPVEPGVWAEASVLVRGNKVSIYLDGVRASGWRWDDGDVTGLAYGGEGDVAAPGLSHFGGEVFVARSGASGSHLYLRDLDLRGWGPTDGGPTRPAEIVFGRPVKPGSSITVIKTDPSTWYEDVSSFHAITDDGVVLLPLRGPEDGGSFPVSAQFVDATANNKNVPKLSMESITDRSLRITGSPSPNGFAIGNNGVYLRAVAMRCAAVTALLDRYQNQGSFRTDLERWLELVDFSVEDHKMTFVEADLSPERRLTVVHNLNRFPQVLLLDGDSIQVTPVRVAYGDLDTVTVTIPEGMDSGIVSLQ
jgi:hypothetical protein